MCHFNHYKNSGEKFSLFNFWTSQKHKTQVTPRGHEVAFNVSILGISGEVTLWKSSCEWNYVFVEEVFCHLFFFFNVVFQNSWTTNSFISGRITIVLLANLSTVSPLECPEVKLLISFVILCEFLLCLYVFKKIHTFYSRQCVSAVRVCVWGGPLSAGKDEPPLSHLMKWLFYVADGTPSVRTKCVTRVC